MTTPPPANNSKRKSLFLQLLSLRNFKGAISIGFASICTLVAITIVSYLVYFHTSIINRYDYIIENTVPTRYYCGVIESCVSRTMSALDNYITTDSDFYRTERTSIWKEDYNEAIDSLMAYTQKWEDKAASALVYEIRFKVNRLKAEQDNIEREHFENKEKGGETKAERVRQINQVKMLADDIKAVLDLIINIQQEEINKTIASVSFDLSNLYYFITPFVLIVLIVGGAGICYWIISTILYRLKIIKEDIRQISRGELPQIMEISQDETQSIMHGLNMVVKDLKKVKEFALAVGEGNFDIDFDAFNQSGEIGMAFLQMRDSLKSVAERDKKVNWAIAGIAHFSNLLRDHNKELKDLAQSFISELVTYIHANQGAIYIANNDYGQVNLELQAWFAFGINKQRQKIIDPGEGLLGESFQEKRRIFITKVPEDYMYISSGLGQAVPSCLLIVPLKVGELVLGMLEVASFKVLDNHEIEFVEKVCESLASEITSVQISEKTKRLLEEAQIKGEMMRAQEEEMRQNMEELQATQEELVRKENEMQRLLEDSHEKEHQIEEDYKILLDEKIELEQRISDLEKQRQLEGAKYELKLQEQISIVEHFKERQRETVQRNKQKVEELEARIRELGG